MFKGCKVKFDKKYKQDLLNSVKEDFVFAEEYEEELKIILNTESLIVNGVQKGFVYFNDFCFCYPKEWFFVIDKMPKRVEIRS